MVKSIWIRPGLGFSLVLSGFFFSCAEGGKVDAPNMVGASSGGTPTGSGGAKFSTGGTTTAPGQGGVTGQGGTTKATGGASNTSGGASSGGTALTGGMASAGRGDTAGGATTTAGAASAAGRATSTGGTISLAGSVATGGAIATGGMISAAGSVATGGMVATAGAAATGGRTSVSNGLEVQLQSCKTTCEPTDNVMLVYLNLVNKGTTALALSDVTLRYYYTDAAISVSQTDYSQISGASATFVAMPTPAATADHYMLIAFSGGTLAAGSSARVEIAAHNSAWQNLNEANDYSYTQATTPTNTTTTTAYQGTTLIWGVEPS